MAKFDFLSRHHLLYTRLKIIIQILMVLFAIGCVIFLIICIVISPSFSFIPIIVLVGGETLLLLNWKHIVWLIKDFEELNRDINYLNQIQNKKTNYLKNRLDRLSDKEEVAKND